MAKAQAHFTDSACCPLAFKGADRRTKYLLLRVSKNLEAGAFVIYRFHAFHRRREAPLMTTAVGSVRAHNQGHAVVFVGAQPASMPSPAPENYRT
jgi:hypothetical protein